MIPLLAVYWIAAGEYPTKNLKIILVSQDLQENKLQTYTFFTCLLPCIELELSRFAANKFSQSKLSWLDLDLVPYSDLTATNQTYGESRMLFSVSHQLHKLFSCRTAERRGSLLEHINLFENLK